MRVNTATITGESLPQGRDAHPSVAEELLHSQNILLAGTSLVSGQARRWSLPRACIRSLARSRI